MKNGNKFDICQKHTIRNDDDFSTSFKLQRKIGKTFCYDYYFRIKMQDNAFLSQTVGLTPTKDVSRGQTSARQTAR